MLLSGILRQRDLRVKDIIFRCNLGRSYGYQIFNGTRRPTRNTLMILALVLKLDTEETRRMFELAERGRIRRKDMFCQYCGKETADDSKFCRHCGGQRQTMTENKYCCVKTETE